MQITGGVLKSLEVISPKTDKVRPTLSKTRMGIFNTLFSIIDFKSLNFLDMFSGSGIMGLEAYSCGFKEIYAVEKDFKTFEILKKNYKNLNIKANLFKADTLKIKYLTQFDVIFLDPPYDNLELYILSLDKIIKENLLKFSGILIIELRKKYNLDYSPYFSLIKEKSYSDSKILFLKLNN